MKRFPALPSSRESHTDFVKWHRLPSVQSRCRRVCHLIWSRHKRYLHGFKTLNPQWHPHVIASLMDMGATPGGRLLLRRCARRTFDPVYKWWIPPCTSWRHFARRKIYHNKRAWLGTRWDYLVGNGFQVSELRQNSYVFTQCSEFLFILFWSILAACGNINLQIRDTSGERGRSQSS